MKLTLIHPCIGRRRGQRYIRSWQMEPLPASVLAGLTPSDVSVTFYDDRLEKILFDAPTDLVAISVETYTARRAYQIASEYRRRGVPVVMGGFHATLAPDEVAQYAESVVIGEAEELWPRLIEDFRAGRLQPRYRAERRPSLAGLRPDRSIFAGKRYLPIGLVEASRGCRGSCEFCAITACYGPSQSWRPVTEIIAEVETIRKPLLFFVDDNLTGNPERARELCRALIPLRVRWVGQASLAAAADEELLALLRQSGCQGLLVGLESLEPENVARMGKGVNALPEGYADALAAFRRHGIRLYVTFLFGYDGDTREVVHRTRRFAAAERFYLAAFNHITPFPGTPLFRRLELAGRLRFGCWWLDPDYLYGSLPLQPVGMAAEEVEAACLAARRGFFSWGSILRRSFDFRVNSRSFFMWIKFFAINAMMRAEVLRRREIPLGDDAFAGELEKVAMPLRANRDVGASHADAGR